jgi:hypothetical protein
MSDRPSASWPILTEIECAARIIKNMALDILAMEAAIAPSKRGSRFQRAIDDLNSKIGAVAQCLEDAKKKLEAENV